MDKKIISVINQKGGVGKTTTVINLAAGLTMKEKKILVIDLDPQGNATTGLGKSNNDEGKSIYNVLIGKTLAQNAIQESSVPGLDLIGSNVNLSGLEVETANESRRAFLLKDKLKVRNSRGKWILRLWLDKTLPEAGAFSKKRGFVLGTTPATFCVHPVKKGSSSKFFSIWYII